MKVETQLQGIDGVLETLRSLPAEVVAKGGGPARTALRKGAMVIVKQARANFRVAVSQPGLSGVTESTGFTEKQIAPKRRNPPSGVRGERFVVTVNYVKHPHGGTFRNQPLRANDIAYLMEVGSSKQPPIPWLRPAFVSRAEDAISAVERELVVAIDRVVHKLAARNKGR